MKYTVFIERTPNNYAGYVPNLPGCVASADTRKEVFKEIREAIAFHIEGMCEDGEPMPAPQTTAAGRGGCRCCCGGVRNVREVSGGVTVTVDELI